ncbi:MAG: T9SS type A sorting domain-containing protein [Flavobacteriaceae bacterium]|nr:T9SS type A sorting domain-containing protein [Flavobacteriaceae bacterium]
MNKLAFVTVAICLANIAVAKKVKFSVDMTGQTIMNTGIHVTGDFQVAAGFAGDWDPAATSMTKETSDTNIYTVVVDIPAFKKYEYRFVNGDQSYEVEIIPEPSRVGYDFNDNRWLYVDSLRNDTGFVGAIRFGENAPAGLRLIRFKVDMRKNMPVDSKGMHVVGGFQGNNPAETRLYSFGNELYEIIQYVSKGAVNFKYVNGNSAAGYESVPTACNVAGNREVIVSSDTVLDVVCFASCGSCFGVGIQPFYFTQGDIQFVEIYPNPFTDKTTVSFGGKLPEQLRILDVMGKEIYIQKNIKQNQFPLDMSSLEKGIYLLEAINGNAREVTKLVKE